MLSKLRSLLVCTIGLGLAPFLPAQAFPGGTVLPVSGNPTLMATGDFNKDGLPDIVYQDNFNGGNLHIMLGNSSGAFTVGQVIAVPVDAGSVVTLADLNGDGNIDILLGNNGSNDGVDPVPGVVSVFLGNGDGTFKSIITSPAQTELAYTQITYRMAIADFDGDGHPDLIFGDGFSYLYFMKGDGQGHLGPAIQLASGFGDVYAVDLNGDGIPDLVNGELNSGFNVLLGLGGAKFATPVTYQLKTNEGFQGSFALADLNGDGHPDVISGGYGTININYGHADGTFDPLVTISNPPNNDPAILGIADLNGDGQPRVFVSSFDGVTVALGATPGGFHMYAGTGYFTSQSVIGDFNGDGYTDVAIPGDNSIVFLYGKPDGTLNAGNSFPAGNEVGGLIMVDVDGDGFPDAVLGPDLLHHGNGDGTFDPSILGGAMNGGSATYVYTGDFDGDGIPDLFTFTDAYFGLGNGAFTQKGTIYPNGFTTNYSVVGDFNQDGLSDIATSYSGYSYNVGVALAGAGRTFSPVIIPFTESPGPLGSADFNGDNCPDLAVAGQTQIYILAGDCTGNFKEAASYLTGYSGDPADVGLNISSVPSDLAVADLDGDGFPDIVYVIPAANLARVLYGSASGAFTEGADIPLAHPSLFVTIGDLDGDGRPDLVFAGHNLLTVMHGQPDRTFGSIQYLAGGFETGKPVLADLRHIGRLDISVPNYGIEGHGANDVGVTYAVLLNPIPGVIVSGVSAKLSSSPNSSTSAQPFTITATLNPPTSGTVLTGTIAFSVDGTSLGSVPVSNNTATIAGPTTLAVGQHQLSAIWSGDAKYPSLTFTATHTIVAQSLPLTLILGSDINPSAFAQKVTFAAAFSATPSPPSSTLTGTLSFYDGTTLLAQQQPSTAGDAFPISTLSVGTHPITAVYSGDSNFAAATSNIVAQVVSGLPTTNTLTVSPSSGNVNTTYTLTSTLKSASSISSAAPSGTVTFYISPTNGDPGIQIGTATPSAGVATLTSSSLPVSSGFAYELYSGDTIYANSTSNSVSVNITAAPATTTTLAITAGGSPVTAVPTGTVVTLTATTLAGAAPVTPGQVNFCDATAPLCTDIHLLGTAQLTPAGTAALKFIPGPGTHSYKAVFLGTQANTTSSSPAEPLTVTSPTNPATITLAETGVPGSYTLTATVSGNATTTPTGTVSFLDTTNANYLLGSASLSATTSGLIWTASTVPTTFSPTSLVAADFNNDGYPDIALTTRDSVSILTGNGNGGFPRTTTVTVGQAPRYLAVADFNGDGTPDLAISNQGDGSVSILTSSGNGFDLSTPIPVGLNVEAITTGDFNHDGNADFAVVYNENSIAVFLGKGDSTFTPVAAHPTTDVEPTSIVTGDFNGDGNLDLIVSNAIGSGPTVNGNLTVLLGNGDGTFTPATSPSTGVNPESIAVGDFNNDGKLDLAVANSTSNTVTILLGNGDGTFSSSSVATGTTPWSVSIADFNGDGVPDILVVPAVGGTATTTLLFGKGDGTFSATNGPVTGNAPLYGVVADFNSDGVPDFVISNAADSTVGIYLTQTSSTATASVNNISPVGTGPHLVDANYPGDSTYATSLSNTVTLTAQRVPTTLTLTATVAPSGSPITLTAAIAPNTAQNHAAGGTVTFYNNGVLLPPGTPINISNGVANLAVASLPAGLNNLSAQYSGDTNFAPSSGTGSITIAQPTPPDFTFIGPQTITFRTEATGVATLSLASLNGFAAPISVICNAPLPPNYLCTLSSSTVILDANNTASLTLSLRPNLNGHADLQSPRGLYRSRAILPITFAALFPLTLLALGRRKRRNPLRSLVLLLCLAAAATALTACGSDIYYPATPPGLYPITLTATGTNQGSSSPTAHTLVVNANITR